MHAVCASSLLITSPATAAVGNTSDGFKSGVADPMINELELVSSKDARIQSILGMGTKDVDLRDR